MGMDERTARGKPIHRRAQRDYGWEGVERLPYKEDERALFKSVSRQILFSDPDLAGELRYFEVQPCEAKLVKTFGSDLAFLKHSLQEPLQSAKDRSWELQRSPPC